MEQRNYARTITTFMVLIVLAALYGGVLHFHHTLTGSTRLDGIVGVMLGLYICSLSAAQIIDVLFDLTRAHVRTESPLARAYWVVFNLLILLLGLIVIFIGTTRFTQPAPRPPVV
jgi:hypothetical protein